MKKTILIFTLVAIATLSLPLNALSQSDIFKTILEHIGSGIIWGSGGIQHFKESRGEFGGGFAAIYGPINLLRYPPPSRKDTIEPLPNPVMTLATGYEYSIHHPGITNFESTIPLGGVTASLFIRWSGNETERVRYYSGIGATFLSISDATALIDGVQTKFSSENTIAPEFYPLVLSYKFSDNMHMVIDFTYQYLNFSSLRYSSAVGNDSEIINVKQKLPNELCLSSFRLKIGVSFGLPGFSQ